MPLYRILLCSFLLLIIFKFVAFNFKTFKKVTKISKKLLINTGQTFGKMMSVVSEMPFHKFHTVFIMPLIPTVAC
jgi:hypothetical protein